MSMTLMSVLFWWTPNLLAVAGLALCLVQGLRKHGLGLILFAVYFAGNLVLSVSAAIRQHQQDAAYLHGFVRQPVGPDTWTAPVLQQNYNLAAPFAAALLLLVAILLAHSLPGRVD